MDGSAIFELPVQIYECMSRNTILTCGVVTLAQEQISPRSLFFGEDGVFPGNVTSHRRENR